MADEKPPGVQFERWLNLFGSVVAPATLIGALLFYFGYVSSRAQYDYFGVDIDSVGLSTQDYVMRSPQPLLVPLLVLALVGATFAAAHARIRRRVDEPDFRKTVRIAALSGVVLVGVGVVMLFTYSWMSDWDFYPLITPLLLGLGSAVTAYGLTMLRFIDRRADAQASDGPGLTVIVLLWAAVAACLFWATATVAQWSGLGLAKRQAENLQDLPSVIVDTKERLHLPVETGVRETTLSDSEDADYRYRYWGLRLLIVGDGQLFVVPNVWHSQDRTLVLPFDDSIRVQFQFRNLPP